MAVFKNVLHLALLFGIFLQEGTCKQLIFPISNLELPLPWGYLRSLMLSPILRTRAVPYLETMHGPNITYEITGTGIEDGALKIDDDGNLWIGNVSALVPNTTFVISANSKGYMLATTILNITSLIGDPCNPKTDICFWKSPHYHVTEGKGQKRIAPLAPLALRSLCPSLKISYRFLNDTKYFLIKDQFLWRGEDVDRDSMSPGPIYNASVRCTMTKNGQLYEEDKVLRINVLDRNDSPPKTQFNVTQFNLTMERREYFKNIIVPHSGDMIIVDEDSDTFSEHFTFGILDDELNILRPQCKSWRADNVGPHRTAISCKLIFTQNGILTIRPYCIVLQVTDTKLEPEFGDPTVNISACIYTPSTKNSEGSSEESSLSKSSSEENLPVDKKRGTTDQFYSAFEKSWKSGPKTQPLRTGPNGVRKKKDQAPSPMKDAVTYPAQVNVFRTASHFARVAQPETNTGPLKFNLSEPSSIFEITTIGGIIYVKNTKHLQEAPKTINISISWDSGASSVIVNLLNDSNPPCDDASYCSIHLTSTKCRSSCGIGTGGINSNNTKCEWRPNKSTQPSQKVTTYATCSPSLQTCPDNICDPLEKLVPLLCKQDCVAKEDIMSMPDAITNKYNIGIFKAVGVCTCNSLSCSCQHEPKPVPTKATTLNPTSLHPTKLDIPSNDDTAVSKHNASAFPPCGPVCMAAAVGGPLIIMLICALLVFRKRRNSHKSRKGVIISQPIMISTNNSHGNISSAMVADEVLLIDPDDRIFKTEADPKWEFPRARLLLEAVLGEGEFGRVLRASATDIGGTPGVSTVAVKTLKEDGRSAELLALLSEFALLQEVSHPNVIRLLGACTQGRAPLLIIEYAEHGSLRNYLRRSRHIENAIESDSGPISPVTPRDILSFAWQISKGMAYLADIKLVHRDLAARNVLLAAGKVCKISDFGLTRDVYEDDAYLKRSKGRVPVKWMAPESLSDHVYTSRSDVWAFGVVVWELVTLGASPYPGVSPHNLYHLLKSGYRMQRPENCSQQIYSIMTSCWAVDPLQRPSFRLLASHWEKLLEQGAEYLDLGTRAVANPGYCSDGVEEFSEATNFLGAPLPKCADADKLGLLWSPPDLSLAPYKNIENSGNLTDNELDLETEKNCKEITDKSELEENLDDIENNLKDVNKFNGSSSDKNKFNVKANIFGYSTPKEQILKLKEFEVPPGYATPKSFEIVENKRPSYENDFKLSTVTLANSNVYVNGPNLNTSQPNLVQNHYETPVKRGKSYVDMQGVESPKKNKQSDEITFKFGSHLALAGNGQITSIM